MATGKPIRITKAHINRRKFFDAIKSPFLRIKYFIKRLFKEQEKTVIQIRKKTDGGYGPELTETSTELSPEISRPSGEPIRIMRRPYPEDLIPPTSERPSVTTTRSRPNNISVDAGVPQCPACRQPFESGDRKAKCQNYPDHFVHKRCVKLMKGKCPKCGGRLISHLN